MFLANLSIWTEIHNCYNYLQLKGCLLGEGFDLFYDVLKSTS